MAAPTFPNPGLHGVSHGRSHERSYGASHEVSRGDPHASAHQGPRQGEFFFCDILNVALKGDLASLEHPLFSLSTRPDRRVLSYVHNDVSVTITPSVKGRATIHDKDILIFCVSQLVAALNAGRAVSRRLTLTAHDLLVATHRETSGDAYRRLKDAFERLAGTRITTNIATGAEETTTGFGLIDGWEILRKSPSHRRGGERGGGRMVSVRVTLSEWLYRAVLARSVLTLSRDYFTLRKPLERRLYELARKHCGRQEDWVVSVETLLKKSGSSSPRRVFRAMVREMIAADPLPEYHVSELPGDKIAFTLRAALLERQHALSGPGSGAPSASPEALEAARALAPGADIYALEADWQAFWARSGRAPLRAPDAAFLGFVKKAVGR